MSDTTTWQNIKIFGRAPLPVEGTWPDVGFTSAQMLEAFINEHCAPLETSSEYLDNDGFVIGQAWYADGQTRGEVVNDLTKYSLYDWFVYHGKRFELRKPGTYGRRWKVYVGPSGLNEVGLDSQRLWRSVVVRYQDVDGTTKTVGPPGVAARGEASEALEITDPSHPAVLAGRTRQAVLDMQGVATPALAVEVGARFLEEANQLSRSGSATLSGYVLDDKGTLFPVSRVRAGDWVSFVDAADASYRKITGVSYSHEDRSAQVDLNAPPEGMQALLERLRLTASATLMGSS